VLGALGTKKSVGVWRVWKIWVGNLSPAMRFFISFFMLVVVMSFRLSKLSRSKLEGVHPDLVKVVERAIEITKIDFGVSEGVRTMDRQRKLKADGKSTTLNSRHLKQSDGYSHAVDLFVLVDGVASWQHKHFRLAIQAMMTAAIELDVQIKAGGLWREFLDSPHFELNKEYYS